jgi:AsmA protein
MRAAKWILIVIGALAAVLAAGVYYVTQVVDANRYKPEIETAVADATGRPLRLEGDIQLSFFPWIALQAGAGSLGNPPGFDGEPLVAWREARIATKLIPLLRDQLVIDRIRVVGANVSLRRLADGRANWQGWGAAIADGQRSANNSLDVAGLELSDGALTYRDDQLPLALLVTDWQLRTSAIHGVEPIDLETSFRIQRAVAAGDAKAVSAALSIEARYTPSPKSSSSGSSSSESPSIENLAVRGALSGLSANEVPVDFRVAKLAPDLVGEQLGATPWRLTLGGLKAQGEVQGAWAGAAATASGKLTATSDDARAALAELGVKAPLTRDAKVFGRFSLASDWAYGTSGLTTESLTVAMDDTRLDGVLKVGPTAPRTIEFRLQGDAIDLTRYLEPEDAVSEPFVFPTAALRALPARGVLEFAEARLADAEMKRVRIRLLLDETGLRSQAPPPK